MPYPYGDRSGTRLLKCPGRSEQEKAVAWHLDARGREGRGILREFTTKSRGAIIADDRRTPDKNVAAPRGPGYVAFFGPDAADVHARPGTWSDDPEIYPWFAAHLHRVREPSLRHHVRARELKAAGMRIRDAGVPRAP